METKFDRIVEQCRDLGVQVEHLADFGYYWFIDSQTVAPSRLFDTEEEAWESAAEWLFTGVEFENCVGANI